MTLDELVTNNPDPRELKRALAVKMRESGYTHHQISEILNVVSSFISKWEKRYLKQGAEGLRLGYEGRKSYISYEQKEEIIQWLKQKGEWNLEELVEHVSEQYHIIYRSLQSYYDLFSAAGISWHKAVKKTPDKT